MFIQCIANWNNGVEYNPRAFVHINSRFERTCSDWATRSYTKLDSDLQNENPEFKTTTYAKTGKIVLICLLVTSHKNLCYIILCVCVPYRWKFHRLITFLNWTILKNGMTCNNITYKFYLWLDYDIYQD